MATQQEVADHLGVNAKTIQRLSKSLGAPAKKGAREYDLDRWRMFYLDYLRNMKGVSGGHSELDMEAESDELAELAIDKARLANEDKREAIKLRKVNRKIKEGAYAPIEIIPIAVTETARALQSRVDGWLPRLKQVWPDMPVEAYQALQKEIVVVMNELSETDINLSAFVDVDIEGD